MVSDKANIDLQARRQRLGAHLSAARARYAGAAAAGRAGRSMQVQYASEMDDLIRSLADEAGDRDTAPFLVCALGGYGRRTLCLHSDVDLLVVFETAIGPAEERFVNGL